MTKEQAIEKAKEKLAKISDEAKKHLLVLVVAHELRDQYDRVHYVWRTMVEQLAQFTRIQGFADGFAKSIGLHIPNRDKTRAITFAELMEAAADEGNSHRIAVVHNPEAATDAKPNGRRAKSQE